MRDWTSSVESNGREQRIRDLRKPKTHWRWIYHAKLLESLADKDEAIAYLKVALEEYEEDHDTEVFMLALRNVADARGGISKLSEKTKLNREHLYRILSKKGNPRLITLDTVLRGLGFKLSIEAA